MRRDRLKEARAIGGDGPFDCLNRKGIQGLRYESFGDTTTSPAACRPEMRKRLILAVVVTIVENDKPHEIPSPLGLAIATEGAERSYRNEPDTRLAWREIPPALAPVCAGRLSQ